MTQTTNPNAQAATQTIKKTWTGPLLYIINQANIEGGNGPTSHESAFTPKHTHYAPNGAGPFPTTVFNNYVS